VTSLCQVVVDKGYMAQLVQVQHMRGAQGGNRFCALLLPGGVEQPSSATKGTLLLSFLIPVA